MPPTVVRQLADRSHAQVLTDPECGVRLVASAAAKGRVKRSPISDWYRCSYCAQYVHALFFGDSSRFYTGCIHEWSDAARVSINFFAIWGETAKPLFGEYARRDSREWDDEPYLTAYATERYLSIYLSIYISIYIFFSIHLAIDRQTDR